MDYAKLYAGYLTKFLKLKIAVKCVCDSSNGTTGLVLRNIKSLKFKLVLINGKPDGRFPVHGPDPWGARAMDALKKKVLATGADFGTIFDADGDRVFFVDDRGRLVPQEAVFLALARDFKPPYLVDVRIGWLAKKSGLKLVESRVGHYFIKKTMAAKKIGFGIELSGHAYFGNRIRGNTSYFDSGLRAFMHFANAVSALKECGSKLSVWLNSQPKYFREPEQNFTVKNKKAAIARLERFYKKGAVKISHLDGLSAEFKDWWFNVRPSNTEPLLRLNIESKSARLLNNKLGEVKKIIIHD